MTVLTPKLLSEGQIVDTVSDGAIYTVPALTTTYIKSMFFRHTNPASQTVFIFIRNGAGTSRGIFRAVMLENYSLEYDGSFALEAGDTIRAYTSNTNVVDYSIYGIEQT